MKIKIHNLLGKNKAGDNVYWYKSNILPSVGDTICLSMNDDAYRQHYTVTQVIHDIYKGKVTSYTVYVK